MKNKKDFEGKEKVLHIVKIVLDRQAKDVVALDIRAVSTLCDYFVVCSGETGRQVQAIADALSKSEGLGVHHVESDDVFSWVMVDCFDVMVHVFTEEARLFYNLEHLWHEAKQIYPAARKSAKPAAGSRAKPALRRALKKKRQPKVVARRKK